MYTFVMSKKYIWDKKDTAYALPIERPQKSVILCASQEIGASSPTKMVNVYDFLVGNQVPVPPSPGRTLPVTCGGKRFGVELFEKKKKSHGFKKEIECIDKGGGSLAHLKSGHFIDNVYV